MIPHEHEQTYAQRMANAMSEKLFFLPLIPEDAIILDYGCGPGDVAASIMNARPDITVIGYDTHAGRISNASRGSGLFFDDEKEAIAAVSRLAKGRPKALLLSSVAHEIATFMGLCELRRVIGLSAHFDMLAYRDMSFSLDAFRTADEPPASVPQWALESFSSRWGAPKNAACVAHLMLKSRYLDNWDAENRENYAAAPLELVRGEITKHHSRSVHINHHTPEFLANDLELRFCRKPLVNTHVSIVSQR